MTRTIDRLCVGGPHAGRRYLPLQGSNTLRVAIMPEYGLFVGTFLVPDRAKAETFEYIAQEFHTPQGKIVFWVPRTQTPLETVTLLTECYERYPRIVR